MSENLQKNKLYEYKANSNLVLEAERDKRRRDEGSAEVESLFGKLDGVKMGDRNIQTTKIDLPSTKKPKINDANESVVFSKPNSNNSKLVISDSSLDSDGYNPKTRDSRLSYEEILHLISKTIGDQPHDIIRGAADEVIAILRSDFVHDNSKMGEIRGIIGKIGMEEYTKLLQLSKRLTDFTTKSDSNGGSSGGGGSSSTSNSNSNNDDAMKLDEEIGVAVVFDDDEDDNLLPDVMNGEDDIVDDTVNDSTVVSQVRGMSTNENSSSDKQELHPNDIDAYWLQRHLSKYSTDANVSSKLAEDILTILSGTDERVIENKLVLLLDFDKFDFVKMLLRNRHVIYFCTKYRQAQSDQERVEVEKEMKNDPSGHGESILNVIHQKTSSTNWSRDRIGEFTSKSRNEARSLVNKSDSVINHNSSSNNNNSNMTKHDIDESDMELLTVSGEINSNNNQSNSNGSIDNKIVLNLSSLEFTAGGHFMSNDSCQLPSKSWRALKKGYEEVHVPAVRPIVPADEVLVKINSLPDWCQMAFSGITSLNRIQSKMLPTALYTSENILLCAPTGAGKTNVALLCMLNLIGRYKQEGDGIDVKSFKIVYIAPMKALVQECVQNFTKRLAPYGIKVDELSGDHNLTKQQLADTQVIVVTPEKWDIVTRKSGDKSVTQFVRLIIIDEIHLLHDDRGPVLEAIVSRTLQNIETTQEMIRLVGLSATLPNFEDVATFLRVNPEKGLFFFDNSFRPVPLQQQYIGITEKKAIKRYNLMNEICYEKVLQHAGKNQVLIFTHSRADTVKTAKALYELAMENDTISQFVKDDSASKEILRDEATNSVKNPELKELLPFGFAIHHAGLLRSDRSLVEDLFADKHIQVLVSTATLAWGINLPCRTVIIKGTQIYSPEKGQWVEMSPLDILQMMGRAGRFGLDSEGEGIILTNHSELQYYLSLMNQQLPIESQLIKKLPDVLNAEVVLGNISTLSEAIQWLGYTFLYIRMLRNPSLYGVSESETDQLFIKRRTNLVHSAALILDKHGLIKYDRRSGYLYSNALGRIGSYFYVNHDSISLYSELMRPDMSDIEIFRLFSLSSEFKNMFVREEEKLEISKLISKVPIPIKESVDETSAKVNVLLQAYISRLKLEGFSLSADMIFIQQSACRLFRALFEVSMKRGWALLTTKLLSLCKMVEKRMWLSQSPLRQFSSIPEMIVRKIERQSGLSWSNFFDLKPQDLGEMVKIPKMGKTLHKFVHLFPKLELNSNIYPITRSLIQVELKITPDFNFDTTFIEPSLLFWIFVTDVDGENLVHYESFSLRSRKSTQDHYVSFFVSISDPLPPQYYIRVVADRWLGCEVVIPVSFGHIILPARFPPPMELLDLQPTPIKKINSIFERVFPNIEVLNPIQTQTFFTLYEGDSIF